MANNYDDGYQSALRGETYSGSGAQEYAGYAAGKEARDRFRPTTNVDGVSFTALACAVPICIIYPIGGAAAVGAMVLTWKIAEWSGVAGASPWVLPLMVLLALVAFFPGFAVEKRLARRKWYRILRDCYRILNEPLEVAKGRAVMPAIDGFAVRASRITYVSAAPMA